MFAAFGGIYHGRIEVADGIFHSLQLLCYLTQEQDIQTVVPCCSSIPLCLLGSIWEFMRTLVQHVKKCFGDQSQAKVPCPSNLRHMFKNKSLHFKWSSRSNFKFSRTPEKLFSFCSTSAQAKVCESECVFHLRNKSTVFNVCINSTQPILSLSTEPDWYDPKTSCLFAALLPCLPWKQMQSTPIHSVCHSIREGLLLVPYSSGCPMFLGSPQPSQQNHGKNSPSSKQLYPPHVLVSSVLFLQRLRLLLRTLWIYHRFTKNKH